ncbi:MAG: oligosaccharide flippase family protein [Candidatus Omnitrophica bacterium]|nr:oligosaccharide flippase family protein [Candidatus Omnitrophota bacterium]
MTFAKHIKQLVTESLIYGILGMLSKPRVINTILLPFYTRIFTPYDYGIMNLLLAFLGFFMMLVVAGLDSSSAVWFYDTKNQEDQKSTFSCWFWCQSVISLFFGVGIIFFSSWLSEVLFDTTKYKWLIQILAFILFFATANRVLTSWFLFQRRAWGTSIVSLMTSFGVAILSIILVYFLNMRLLGVFWAQLIGTLMTTIATVWIMKDWLSLKYFSWLRLKKMLAFGLPLAPASVASWIIMFSDSFILKYFYDSTEIGLYAVAFNIAGLVGIFTAGFQMAWSPFAYSIQKEEVSGHVYAKVLSLYGWAGCFFCTACSLFASFILKVLATPEYSSAASAVPFLAFSFLLLGIRDIASIGPAFVKKSVPVALSIFIAAGLNIILNLILVPLMGKDGAAFASMVSYLISAVYLFWIAQKHFYIPYEFKPVLVCFCFSWIIIAINMFFIPLDSFWGFVFRVVLCSLFLPLAFYLKVLTHEHVRKLIQKIHLQHLIKI